jgi:TP901 family phage tail tape measure protein
MSVYNIKAEDMKNVTNSIVGVANASRFSVEDFGLAMSQGGGVAKQVGVEFDDFTATIAAVASGFQS